MYVNTLITLQENLATYAVNGKKVTGHVTINSPGIIKCYVQNLKSVESGVKYTCFAFSKAQDKGVRLGELGTHKESKWLVEEKNVQGSGLKLEDLDAVAIVAENQMRGADTIAMGFKNNRYIIIPMIDDIIKRMPSIGSQVVKPDPIVEGTHSITKSSNNKNTSYSLKEGYSSNSSVSANTSNQGSGSNQGTQQNTGNTMPNQGTNWSQGSGSNQGTQQNTGNTMANQGMNWSQGNGSNQGAQQNTTNTMPNQGMNWSQGNGSNQGAQQNTTNTMPNQGMNWSQGSGSNQGAQQNNNSMMESTAVQQAEMTQVSNIPVNNNNTYGQGETLEESDFTKVPILKNEFEAKLATESIENEDAELIKIAEKLNETEKEPAIQKGVKSGIPYASNPATATVVRDDEEQLVHTTEIIEKTSEELKRIIAKLKDDKEIKEKILDIEKQVQNIRQSPEEYRATDKSKVEQTLEKNYVSKQRQDTDEREQFEPVINVEDDLKEFIQEEEIDTSPKKALAFIKSHLNSNMQEDVNDSEAAEKITLEQQESIQNEIDYIKEIDRRIQDIAERRRQENLKK